MEEIRQGLFLVKIQNSLFFIFRGPVVLMLIPWVPNFQGQDTEQTYSQQEHKLATS